MHKAFSIPLLGLLSCAGLSMQDADSYSPLVIQGDDGTTRLDAATFVTHAVLVSMPDAELVGERDVSTPSGDYLGTLLTFEITGPDVDAALEVEDGCDTMFCGANLYSVLASDLESLPMWAFASAGGPEGAPEEADLVYDAFDGGWYWFVGDMLRSADDGYLIDPAELYEVSPDPVLVATWADDREAAWLEMLSPVMACTGSYGSSLGSSLWGVTAYSNGTSGACTGTGYGTYQCVQYIDRFHTVTASHVGNANTYDDGDNPRKMNMIYFANNNGTYGPKVGDIVISNGGAYGHVAIAYSVPTTTMTVIHQNWSSATAQLTMSRANTNVSAFSASYSVAGWSRPGWELGGNLDSTAGIYGWSIRNATITAEDSTGFTLNPGSDPGILTGTFAPLRDDPV